LYRRGGRFGGGGVELSGVVSPGVGGYPRWPLDLATLPEFLKFAAATWSTYLKIKNNLLVIPN
jgi:hypothetical protein